MEALNADGVEVIIRDGEALAYSPGPREGEKGQIILNDDASITASQHEYQHYLDDRVAGFLGKRGLFDSNYCVGTEANAYLVKIQTMNDLAHTDVARQLAQNFQKEMMDVIG